MHTLELEVSPPKICSGFSRHLQHHNSSNKMCSQPRDKQIPNKIWHTKSVVHDAREKSLTLKIQKLATGNNLTHLKCIGDSMIQSNLRFQKKITSTPVHNSVCDIHVQYPTQTTFTRCRPSTTVTSGNLKTLFIRVLTPGTDVKADLPLQWHLAQHSFATPPVPKESTPESIAYFCREKFLIYSRWEKLSEQILNASKVFPEVGFLDSGTGGMHPMRRMFFNRKQTAK